MKRVEKKKEGENLSANLFTNAIKEILRYLITNYSKLRAYIYIVFNFLKKIPIL
jgi:hypothetical protein